MAYQPTVATTKKKEALAFCYEVLYHKYTRSKKKKYFDGILLLRTGKKTVLMDPEGKKVSALLTKVEIMPDGSTLGMGKWVCEVQVRGYLCFLYSLNTYSMLA